MVAFTFGEAARCALTVAAARPRGCDVPVRQGSLEAGSFEKLFFTAPAPGETDRLLKVARYMLDAGRKLKRDARADGRALGAADRLVASLTASAVRVLEELLTLARLTSGRVYPSYDRLAGVTGLGRATIARAITCLEAIGFLHRQRRFVRIEGNGAGPRYAQTSNAYRLLLPDRVRRFLPRWMRPIPVPDCESQSEVERKDVQAAMLTTLSCSELAATTVDGFLGRTLAALGAALDRQERESHRGSETPTQIYHPCGDCAPAPEQRSERTSG